MAPGPTKCRGGGAGPPRRGAGDGAHRNWMSVGATSFCAHKVQWTLSCCVPRKVKSPHQFLSSPSDLQIPPNQGSPHVKQFLWFKEFGTFWGGRSLDICQVESWTCTCVQMFGGKKSALEKLTCLDCHLWMALSAIIVLSFQLSLYWQHSRF